MLAITKSSAACLYVAVSLYVVAGLCVCVMKSSPFLFRYISAYLYLSLSLSIPNTFPNLSLYHNFSSPLFSHYPLLPLPGFLVGLPWGGVGRAEFTSGRLQLPEDTAQGAQQSALVFCTLLHSLLLQMNPPFFQAAAARCPQTDRLEVFSVPGTQ